MTFFVAGTDTTGTTPHSNLRGVSRTLHRYARHAPLILGTPLGRVHTDRWRPANHRGFSETTETLGCIPQRMLPLPLAYHEPLCSPS
jgi:hypothetical protein